MFKLTPSNTQFYDHFDRATALLVKSAEQFQHYLENFQELGLHAEEMKNTEHQADEITHQTMELLEKSFITPIERSDIRRLVMTMDDVVDFLDDATRRIALYEIEKVFPEVLEQAPVVVKATKKVQEAVAQLRQMRRKNDILKLCIEIHRLEDDGDAIHHKALANLFKSGLDPLMVIKWKDIIEDVEAAIDSCQDVADVVEGIVLENS